MVRAYIACMLTIEGLGTLSCFYEQRGGLGGLMATPPTQVLRTLGWVFGVFVNCFRFGGWILSANRPIRRCDHFDQTVLPGDRILLHVS